MSAPRSRLLAGFCVCLALSLVLPSGASAVDCGEGAWCPCPSGGRCLGSHSTCEEACGLTQPGGGSYRPASNGYDAAAAARNAAAARAADLEAENARRAKDAQEKKEREEQFIRDRDASVGELRGVVGEKSFGSGSDPKLRGIGVVDTGLRDARPDRTSRGDLDGTHAAWKQLNCAAGIAGYALASLHLNEKSPRSEPEFKEFSYLSGEAINALTGETVGVECPAAAPLPHAYGKEGAERYKKDYLAMIEQSRKLADVLEKTVERRGAAQTRVFEAKKRLTPLREAPAVAIPQQRDAPPTEAPAKPEKKKGQAAELAAAALREAERQERELTRLEAETRRKLETAEQLTKEVEAGNDDAFSLLEQEAEKK